MNKKFLAITIGLVVTIFTASFSSFAVQCSEIRESTLRLHILANSNTEYDQKLKLLVRDRLLQDDLYNANSVESAINQVNNKLEYIRSIAQAVVLEQGYTYPVKAELTNMFFETREYEEFTLPAGWYNALRVTIGEAKGKNWWCVLYPPLCIPSATGDVVNEYLKPNQVEIVKGRTKYRVSFAFLEFLERFTKR